MTCWNVSFLIDSILLWMNLSSFVCSFIVRCSCWLMKSDWTLTQNRIICSCSLTTGMNISCERAHSGRQLETRLTSGEVHTDVVAKNVQLSHESLPGTFTQQLHQTNETMRHHLYTIKLLRKVVTKNLSQKAQKDLIAWRFLCVRPAISLLNHWT